MMFVPVRVIWYDIPCGPAGFRLDYHHAGKNTQLFTIVIKIFRNNFSTPP